MKLLTIDDALGMVPTHQMLVPDHDIWQIGDEYYWLGHGWEDASHLDGTVMEVQLGRRPIPDEVRRDLAKTIVFLSGVKTEASIGSPDLAYAKWLLATGRAA